MTTKEVEEMNRAIDRVTFDFGRIAGERELPEEPHPLAFKRIVVGVDGSEAALRAEDEGNAMVDAAVKRLEKKGVKAQDGGSKRRPDA